MRRQKNKHKWWENHSVIRSVWCLFCPGLLRLSGDGGDYVRHATKSPQNKYLWSKVCGRNMQTWGKMLSVSITPELSVLLPFTFLIELRGEKDRNYCLDGFNFPSCAGNCKWLAITPSITDIRTQSPDHPDTPQLIIIINKTDKRVKWMFRIKK